MSLKKRLDRIEATANWLRYDGWALLLQRQMEVLDLKRCYDEAVERQERAKEQAREQAAQRAAQQAAQEAAREAACAAAEEARLAAAQAAQEEPAPVHDAAPVGALAPPLEPPPEPEPPPQSTDIPEEMQIRPVRWRRRGPEDWQDDMDDGDVPSVLTEYDPLAEWDDDSS